jgi:periplasmic divalent cation tolerance protein
VIIILTTYPNKKTAQICARALVKEKLAACVNIVKIESSVFFWKGRIKEEKEFMLIIKAKASAYKGIETLIRKRHPYELPEIIRVPVQGGLRSYLDWVEGK